MSGNKGNMLLTLVIILALSAVLMSFLYILMGRSRDASYEQNRVKALYIAEAGIDKAVWDLMTPASLGGQGSSWRTAGTTEGFAGGQYSVSVLDSAGNILITSTGEASSAQRTIQQTMTSSALPAAFNYAIYDSGSLTLKGNSNIRGPIFSNGNITISGNSNHSTGETDVSLGSTVTVNGKTVPGTVLNPAPAAPTLNTSFYTSNISAAQTASAGNKTLSNYNLNGGTLYVKGNATISGNISGGGTIVVTGTTNISGNVTIGPNTTLISNNAITIAGNINVQTGGVLYSGTSISDSGNNRMIGSIMAPQISIAGNDTIYGFLYSWGVSVALTGNITMYGAVVNPATATYSGNINIYYDPSYLPSAPPGLASGGLSLVKGSWKEL